MLKSAGKPWKWPFSAFRFEPPRDNSRIVADSETIQRLAAHPLTSAVTWPYSRLTGEVIESPETRSRRQVSNRPPKVGLCLPIAGGNSPPVKLWVNPLSTQTDTIVNTSRAPGERSPNSVAES